ncbi:hypothetical protein CIHG_06697 [Coccidioides immitis H538.4]|uniref:Uncharacterized protein n=2 Tax=Coccidioides immitis TaxID=5501 RepID=A0A0J8RUN6_COCIT|nr:hypothetical protein CIRG_01589 [Coccidioides immitis RMSCC 2394]KMU88895.1 hypothetical protein CIHG_06697 [Coccidioides immitis H538.4]
MTDKEEGNSVVVFVFHEGTREYLTLILTYTNADVINMDIPKASQIYLTLGWLDIGKGILYIYGICSNTNVRTAAAHLRYFLGFQRAYKHMSRKQRCHQKLHREHDPRDRKVMTKVLDSSLTGQAL